MTVSRSAPPAHDPRRRVQVRLATASFDRQTITIVAAVALPLLMLLGFLLFTTLSEQQQEVERLSMAAAHEVAAVVEGEVTSDINLGRVLASASVLRTNAPLT